MTPVISWCIVVFCMSTKTPIDQCERLEGPPTHEMECCKHLHEEAHWQVVEDCGEKKDIMSRPLYKAAHGRYE